MKATIEHSFCPYCDEVTELYFRIINTILFSTDETELRTGMERLYNPQIEMFAHFKTKSSFHKTKRII